MFKQNVILLYNTSTYSSQPQLTENPRGHTNHFLYVYTENIKRISLLKWHPCLLYRHIILCQSREKRYRKFFQVWKFGGNIKTAHQHQQQQQQHQQKSIRSVLWEGESVSVRVPGIHPVDIYTYSMSNPRRTSTVWAYLVAWIYVLPIYFLLTPSTRYLVYTYSITGDHINSK